MRIVFADAFYWVALLNPADTHHRKAHALSASMQPVRIVTTDDVLDEVLAFFAVYGASTRAKAVRLVHDIHASPTVEALPQPRSAFLAGLRLHEQRPDKSYSLTDCISMQTMRERGLTEALTHDHHFAQEGFTILL